MQCELVPTRVQCWYTRVDHNVPSPMFLDGRPNLDTARLKGQPSLALTESQPFGDGGGLYNPYPMTHGLGSEKLDILLCNFACNIRFDTLWCEVVITFTACMYLPQHPPNIQGGQSHPSVFFHILFYSCTKLTASQLL